MPRFIRESFLWVLLLPLGLIFFGAASNQLVLWANDNTFPVKVNPVKVKNSNSKILMLDDGTIMLDDEHCVMTSRTHLNILADNWDLKSEGIESIGDLLIELGEWLWVFCPFVWGFAVLWRIYDAIH